MMTIVKAHLPTYSASQFLRCAIIVVSVIFMSGCFTGFGQLGSMVEQHAEHLGIDPDDVMGLGDAAQMVEDTTEAIKVDNQQQQERAQKRAEVARKQQELAMLEQQERLKGFSELYESTMSGYEIKYRISSLSTSSQNDPLAGVWIIADKTANASSGEEIDSCNEGKLFIHKQQDGTYKGMMFMRCPASADWAQQEMHTAVEADIITMEGKVISSAAKWSEDSFTLVLDSGNILMGSWRDAGGSHGTIRFLKQEAL